MAPARCGEGSRRVPSEEDVPEAGMRPRDGAEAEDVPKVRDGAGEARRPRSASQRDVLRGEEELEEGGGQDTG